MHQQRRELEADLIRKRNPPPHSRTRMPLSKEPWSRGTGKSKIWRTLSERSSTPLPFSEDALIEKKRQSKNVMANVGPPLRLTKRISLGWKSKSDPPLRLLYGISRGWMRKSRPTAL